jgi:signal transduction histidine kinase
MNNRAKIINGKLVVDSSLNKGTKIYFEASLN